MQTQQDTSAQDPTQDIHQDGLHGGCLLRSCRVCVSGSTPIQPCLLGARRLILHVEQILGVNLVVFAGDSLGRLLAKPIIDSVRVSPIVCTDEGINLRLENVDPERVLDFRFALLFSFARNSDTYVSVLKEMILCRTTP